MKTKKTLDQNKTNIALGLILPAFTVYAVIILLPILLTLINSFTKWNGMSPQKVFIGFRNYSKAFLDENFGKAFLNNLVWTAFFVTVPLVLSLFIGLAVTKKGIKGRDTFQAIYFIPYILSSVVISLIWVIMLSPNVGILSWFLQYLHIVQEPYGLLGDPKRALYGLIFTHIWNQFGFCAVIYITGLQNIDPELYDAAEIDGANAFQKLHTITLPELTTVTTMLVLVNLMNSFKTFDFVFLMTMGGPGQSTEVVAYKIYVDAFQMHKFGYASAQAMLLSIIICSVGAAYILIREKKEN
jgi:ABC-type sugar transport system permease subunit